MTTQTLEDLASKKCVPCEGKVPRYTPDEARQQLQSLSGWRLMDDSRAIEKHWQRKDFMAAIDFFNRIARLAEDEGHHPDLHLAGYRHVWVDLSTHAAGGLTENDFILAAKIDQLVGGRG